MYKNGGFNVEVAVMIFNLCAWVLVRTEWIYTENPVSHQRKANYIPNMTRCMYEWLIKCWKSKDRKFFVSKPHKLNPK